MRGPAGQSCEDGGVLPNGVDRAERQGLGGSPRREREPGGISRIANGMEKSQPAQCMEGRRRIDRCREKWRVIGGLGEVGDIAADQPNTDDEDKENEGED